MTNPDSVGPEPKEVNTSQPTSARKPMAYREALEWKYWAGVQMRRKGDHYTPSVEGLAYSTEEIALNKFRESLLTKAGFGSAKEYDSILGPNAEGTARRAVSPQLPNQVAPQRGEVGEEDLELETLLAVLDMISEGYPTSSINLRETARTAALRLRALSRPPVVAKTEAALIEACIKRWIHNEGDDYPVIVLTEKLAAERALAVGPETN